MKKTKNTIAWLAGASCYIVLALTLSAYDNAEMHPAINDNIVDRFLQKVVNALNPPDEIKGYTFVLNGSHEYVGPAVTAAGYFASTTTESDVSKKPKEWIAHGGFSADVPEVPAALRHFYDPKGIDGGKTWLTDRGTNWEWLVNNGAFNPQINARDWALTHDDNPWSFAKGKQYIRQALAAEDDAQRDALMAKAWRCLGETLHLVADMGCPVHVRNDSHADLAGWQYRRALGDPDPYEVMVTPAFAAKYAGGKVDPALQSACRGAESATEIFNSLATFTNENFFTNQTISGTGVKKFDPIIKGRPAYPSPKLENLSYDPTDFTFYKTFPGGQKVKMCKDRSYWYFRGQPYIDLECVESQASVLMPNIMEAGSNVMRLFMPHLKVKISEATADGSVKGSVTHLSTKEYTSTATCSGTVRILVKNSIVGEGLLKADGSFELEGVNIEKDDEVVAEYRIGGIYVRSEPVIAGDPGILAELQSCTTVAVEFSAVNKYANGQEIDETAAYGATYLDESIGMQPIAWSGRSFSFSLVYSNSTLSTDWSLSGTVSADGRTIENMRITSITQWSGGATENDEMRLRDLPLDETYSLVPVGEFNYGSYYPECQNMLEFFKCQYEGSSQGQFDYVETLWGPSDRLYVSFYK
ncbi:hypothetical protein KQI65_15725 [bacterium]|nr:hypothetical protein [bacterium]